MQNQYRLSNSSAGFQRDRHTVRLGSPVVRLIRLYLIEDKAGARLPLNSTEPWYKFRWAMHFSNVVLL